MENINIDLLKEIVKNPIVSHSLLIVGAFYTISFVLNCLSGIYARCLRGGKNLKKYGEWAIVTGATDGLGLAMAKEFARKGLNVMLISRTQEKLDACAQEITDKYKVKVSTLAIDFSTFDANARRLVQASVEGKDIGVLVNNVGISYPFTKYFDELEDDEVSKLISMNVDSTTWMTRIVLPNMKKNKRGAIVNISSAAGVQVSPLLAQYGAAKSYVAMFSRALNAELNTFKIHVQCQVPLFVSTKLAKIRHSSLFVPSPAGYAKAAIATIGYEDLVSPYWTHALQFWVMSLLPEWVVIAITKNMHVDIRKKGMKKAAAASGADTSSSGGAKGGSKKKI